MKARRIRLNLILLTGKSQERKLPELSDGLERHDLPLPNGFGEGWIERLPLSLGFTLARSAFVFW